MEIAVLIPCYNEEMTIGKVIKDFQKTLPDATIYVYDNNSTDKTIEEAKKCGVIVRSEKTQGKGAVIRSMFRDIDADIYVMVDGDDTYPPDKVPEMIHLLTYKKLDLVIGDRLSTDYFRENKKFTHFIGNKVVPAMINFLYKTGVQDVMSGSRVFSKRFVKGFPAKKNGFETETEMIVFASKAHMKIGSIPVPYRDRPDGSFTKVNAVKDGIKIVKFMVGEKFRKERYAATTR